MHKKGSYVVVAITADHVHVYGKGFTSTPYKSRSGADALATRITWELISENRLNDVKLIVKRII